MFRSSHCSSLCPLWGILSFVTQERVPGASSSLVAVVPRSVSVFLLGLLLEAAHPHPTQGPSPSLFPSAPPIYHPAPMHVCSWAQPMMFYRTSGCEVIPKSLGQELNMQVTQFSCPMTKTDSSG